ncbi:MAG: DNA topoisomerase 3 [Bacteroidaceae bacterium]|nr:DNA topoisomerase 3 [Bacteroidaceae bacterium]
MIVCIAEKPSVAKDIADVLGARSRKEGYIEGNGYRVTWTIGHLCTLKEPHDYTEIWKRWSLGSLPMIPPRFGIKLITNRGIEKQFAIIEQLIQNAEYIVNCGDAGQEGELIQRWVMQKAGARCPVKRLWISSLTPEAIREGFNNLKDQSEYQPLYEAGLSRAIGDWLLGMNATRLYTLKYGRDRQVLSIGRVQTPTLALIVKRYHEITNFVPTQYWELKTLYRETTFNATSGRFDSEAEAQEALQKITGQPFTVTDVTAKNSVENPPRLYDLTSLQADCNRKYALTAETTLQTIQSLYEKKATTYPRVDTTYLSDDIYPKCESILKGLRDYQPLTAPLIGKPLIKSKKVFDNKQVTDHHAIIPTGVYPQGLTDIEKKVYDLVVRHFIAVFYPECKFRSTTVQGQSAGVNFKATGKVITSPGWKVVFAQETNDEQENKSDKEKILPPFTKGESGPHTPGVQEKWTQAPKNYTEETLLRAMESAGKNIDDEELREAMKENGIGRPSTRAEIIEKLCKRNYIRRERKNLIATPTGIELISLIRNELLKSAELTGQWEKKLRDIEKRKYEAKTFIDELKAMLAEVVNEVLSDNSSLSSGA